MIHKTMATPLSDFLMAYITDLHKTTWFLPLFVPIMLVLWFIRRKFTSFTQMLCLVLAIGASDVICARVLKPTFQRPRPIHAGLDVTLKSETGRSKFGFPSNHAANVFAAATVLGFFFSKYSFLFFFIAWVVAFSRVYLGVHYPGDVLFGAFIGSIIGKAVLYGNELLVLQPAAKPKGRKITLKQRMEKLRRSQK